MAINQTYFSIYFYHYAGTNSSGTTVYPNDYYKDLYPTSVISQGVPYAGTGYTSCHFKYVNVDIDNPIIDISATITSTDSTIINALSSRYYNYAYIPDYQYSTTSPYDKFFNGGYYFIDKVEIISNALLKTFVGNVTTSPTNASYTVDNQSVNMSTSSSITIYRVYLSIDPIMTYLYTYFNKNSLNLYDYFICTRSSALGSRFLPCEGFNYNTQIKNEENVYFRNLFISGESTNYNNFVNSGSSTDLWYNYIYNVTDNGGSINYQNSAPYQYVVNVVSGTVISHTGTDMDALFTKEYLEYSGDNQVSNGAVGIIINSPAKSSVKAVSITTYLCNSNIIYNVLTKAIFSDTIANRILNMYKVPYRFFPEIPSNARTTNFTTNYNSFSDTTVLTGTFTYLNPNDPYTISNPNSTTYSGISGYLPVILDIYNYCTYNPTDIYSYSSSSTSYSPYNYTTYTLTTTTTLSVVNYVYYSKLFDIPYFTVDTGTYQTWLSRTDSYSIYNFYDNAFTTSTSVYFVPAFKVAQNANSHLRLAAFMLLPKFYNFLDYEPYSRYSIYLPFYGEYDLPYDKFLGSIVNIWFELNIISGDSWYIITTQDGVIDKIEVSTSEFLSITTTNQLEIENAKTNAKTATAVNALKSISSAAITVATWADPTTIATGIVNSAVGFISNQVNIANNLRNNTVEHSSTTTYSTNTSYNQDLSLHLFRYSPNVKDYTETFNNIRSNLGFPCNQFCFYGNCSIQATRKLPVTNNVERQILNATQSYINFNTTSNTGYTKPSTITIIYEANSIDITIPNDVYTWGDYLYYCSVNNETSTSIHTISSISSSQYNMYYFQGGRIMMVTNEIDIYTDNEIFYFTLYNNDSGTEVNVNDIITDSDYTLIKHVVVFFTPLS